MFALTEYKYNKIVMFSQSLKISSVFIICFKFNFIPIKVFKLIKSTVKY